MRKIGFTPILVFLSLFLLSMVLGILTTRLILGNVPLGDFRGITLFLGAIFFIYGFAILCYRIFIWIFPLQEGELEVGSRGELSAHVHSLFFLMLFNSLVRTNFLPTPLMRLVYQALGARMGRNSFSVGAILDPALTSIGSDSIIGHNAALFSHAIEGNHYSQGAICVGNNVTVGANSTIMSDVIVGDGAIISAGAVVAKGSRIGAGEIWGGIPARLIGHVEKNECA